MFNFTTTELADIVYGDYRDTEIIDEIEGENGRWTRYMTTIFKFTEGDQLYAIDWEQGLTEYQENEFYSQPYEVEPYTETITITKYKPRKGND